MTKVTGSIYEVYIGLELTKGDISEVSYFIDSESDEGSFNKLNKFISIQKAARG